MDVLESTILRNREGLGALPATLLLSVVSPCQGQQTLTKVNDSAYSGSNGDFTLVNLYSISEGGNESWALQIINYGSTPSGCQGITNFRLSEPSDDPTGTYCLWNGSSKDCSTGQAIVSTT